MKRLLVLTCSVFLTLTFGAGCARLQDSSASAPASPAFFTDNQGPSKESGDCGGYAFWLQESDGRYRAGEVAEFEGGCGVYRRAMIEVDHDPKTGVLTFLAPGLDPNQLLRFRGHAHANRIEGRVEQLEAKDQKPLTAFHPRVRIFPRTDAKAFEARLPQNQ